MRNEDIKYKTSTDYKKLYKLLKEGNVLIGFIAINIDNKISNEFSMLITMSYNTNYKFFDIGFTIFESDFNKNRFEEICKKYNLRFIEF